jgi:hypothetical protein
MKPRSHKIKVEEAAILSLVVSLTLVLLTIFGWTLWATASQLLASVLATASTEIP